MNLDKVEDEEADLRFDLGYFKRKVKEVISTNQNPAFWYDFQTEILTKQAKQAMKTLPEHRNEEDIAIIVRGMQSLDEFTYYTIDVQKQMAKYLFYEEYGPNRTIFKQGNNSDFMYFIVMGACKYSVAWLKCRLTVT